MALMQDKVIAVTGAASGIGFATAKLLASRGATLSLADLNQIGLSNAVNSLDNSAKHLVTVVDVSKTAEINSWIEKTVQKFGKLDGAANIAGVPPTFKTLADSKDEDWDLVMNVNGRGVYFCMASELNNMKDGGAIVNMASITGLLGLPSTSAYVASKHAVIGMTKSAARENADRKIRVNAVAPGVIDTPLVRRLGTEGITLATSGQCMDRQGQSVEVANVIAFLLSDEASFVTGSVYGVDGGWAA